MKLIAESSSTRTEWVLVEDNRPVQRAFTEGLNPFFQTRREISRSVRLNLPEEFFRKKLEQVFFYGSGCSSHEKKTLVGASLVAQFKAPIQVESNLLAAARGLFQCEEGIVCILGTGSNSCFYNGRFIVKNVRPGGYILGDEGGADALGKLFLSDLLKGLAPKELSEAFYQQMHLNADDVMAAVYNTPLPNLFMASAGRFLSDYTNNEYARTLINRNLRDFFLRNVTRYDYRHYPIRFVGQMAVKLAPQLRAIAGEFDITLPVIEETPMQGLIEYHALNIEDS